MRALLAISLAFTIFSSTTSACADPLQQPATASAATPLEKPASQPDLQPMTLAVKHCLTLQDSITQQYRLIDAFNNQPDLDHLPKNISDAAREKTILYMMGRPDIAGFGFLVPDIWMLADRNLRQKWNALITLRLDEILGFRNNGYFFAGNCKARLIGEIAKSKTDNFTHARIEMPLAFDQTQAELTYLFYKQDGYNWQMDDLLINGIGVTHYLDKRWDEHRVSETLAGELKLLCKKSSFSNLNCN